MPSTYITNIIQRLFIRWLRGILRIYARAEQSHMPLTIISYISGSYEATALTPRSDM